MGMEVTCLNCVHTTEMIMCILALCSVFSPALVDLYRVSESQSQQLLIYVHNYHLAQILVIVECWPPNKLTKAFLDVVAVLFLHFCALLNKHGYNEKNGLGMVIQNAFSYPSRRSRVTLKPERLSMGHQAILYLKTCISI